MTHNDWMRDQAHFALCFERNSLEKEVYKLNQRNAELVRVNVVAEYAQRNDHQLEKVKAGMLEAVRELSELKQKALTKIKSLEEELRECKRIILQKDRKIQEDRNYFTAVMASLSPEVSEPESNRIPESVLRRLESTQTRPQSRPSQLPSYRYYYD
jgi:hypothetical protein